MATKQIFFYATHDDLVTVIKEIEKQNKIKYYRAGLLDKKDLTEYSTLLSNELGIANSGDNNLCNSYIVLDAIQNLQLREVPQRKGGVKFAVDQMMNKNSIYFRPCGKLQESQAIVEGKVGTISDDKSSIQLFNCFTKEFKSSFVKIKGILIGKVAYDHYKDGWRLTQNIQSPKEYDLRID